MGDRLIHFDMYSSDPAASVAFFETALGWKFDQWGDFAYWLATTGEGEPGINGAVSPVPEGKRPYTKNTVQVTDLDAAIAACEAAGGTRTAEIQEAPGIGRWTGIREPGGNDFDIIEPHDA